MSWDRAERGRQKKMGRKVKVGREGKMGRQGRMLFLPHLKRKYNHTDCKIFLLGLYLTEF